METETVDEIAVDFSLNKVAMVSVVTAHFAGLLLGPLVAVISPSISLIIMGILIIGVGFGILEGSMSTLITDVAATNMNRVLNISQIFFSIGTVAGPFIAMAAIVYTGNWKLLYAADIVFCIYFLIVFKKYPYPDYRIEEKIKGTITLKLLREKKFLVLCLSMIMYVGIEDGLAFWITTYAKEWGPQSITRALCWPCSGGAW